MTGRSTNRRLQTTHDAIHSQPLQLQTIDRAYGKFLRTGELPAVQPLAKSVLRRALFARKASADRQASMPMLPVRQTDSSHRPRATPREQVFGEALYADEPVRFAARTIIDTLVAAGEDPTDPEFIPSDIPEPEFGSMALYILGWPDEWVRPQYEQQLQRVLVQHRALRLLPNRDEAWYLEAARALAAFQTRGDLPMTLFGLYARTMGEMFAIHADYVGKGDQELLAAYEVVGTTTGDEHIAAMRQLGALQVQRRGN